MERQGAPEPLTITVTPDVAPGGSGRIGVTLEGARPDSPLMLVKRRGDCCLCVCGAGAAR